MDIQFMKDYYDLRYEETDGENHFVEETAYQEKQSEHSKMEDQLMEMVGGTESNVWKLYESIMCVYFDMEEILLSDIFELGKRKWLSVGGLSADFLRHLRLS